MTEGRRYTPAQQAKRRRRLSAEIARKQFTRRASRREQAETPVLTEETQDGIHTDDH